MGLCTSAEAMELQKTHLEFVELDRNKDNCLNHSEVGVFIQRHPELWAMLGVNLDLSDEKCQEIATDVALRIACNRSDGDVSNRTMNEVEFNNFKRIVANPKQQQNFFHQTVFEAFDEDKNGLLDPDEFDKFLDTFYATGSIFRGDGRLPPKEELKEIAYKRWAKDGNRNLNFHAFHMLISGSAGLGTY